MAGDWVGEAVGTVGAADGAVGATPPVVCPCVGLWVGAEVTTASHVVSAPATGVADGASAPPGPQLQNTAGQPHAGVAQYAT